jgi:hypothetical protein
MVTAGGRVALRDEDVDAIGPDATQVGPEQSPLAVEPERGITTKAVSCWNNRTHRRSKTRSTIRRHVELKQRSGRDVHGIDRIDRNGRFASAAQRHIDTAAGHATTGCRINDRIEQVDTRRAWPHGNVSQMPIHCPSRQLRRRRWFV